MYLEGKAAIITGGGRGIGRGIARRFAQEGAQVVLAQRDRESGERTCSEIAQMGGAATYIETDVSQRRSVGRLVDETVRLFGTIDILVNNAAITGTNGHILDLSQEI